ncbi:MAG: hypothetical protein AB7G28_06675 [Pirellulales bacterium]
MIRSVIWTLLAFATFTAPASAALVDLTWTGTTLFGANDGLGLFGPAGPIDAGTSYIARYRFDTSIGYVANATNGSEEVVGGTFFNPATPIPLYSADITINGTSVSANGDYYSQFFRQTGQGASQISALAQREPTAPVGGELFQRVFRLDNYYSLPLALPGEFDFDASDNPGGEFLQLNRDAQGNILGSTQIGLAPAHLSITLVVPEPASVMITLCSALGGLSLLARRTR